MTLGELILAYQQKGIEKTKAIEYLNKKYGIDKVVLSDLWIEIKEANYTEEKRVRKRGTGRQVKASAEDLLICKAISTFGEDNQKRIAQEELAELIQAISKDCRGLEHNVEEEIADVEIMLEQLRRIYDKDKVNKWKENKLKRLRLRIKEREANR